jgi:hypothetical protein
LTYSVYWRDGGVLARDRISHMLWNPLPRTFSASPCGRSAWATLPLPHFLLNSWRLVAGGSEGDLPTFPLGIFSPPSPPSAFFSSPRAPFERRHPGPERVLQFNYFQILCSGHSGTPLSAIESAGRPAGAPLRRRPESIRPPLGPLRPIDAPASPGSLAAPLLSPPLPPSAAFFGRSGGVIGHSRSARV